MNVQTLIREYTTNWKHHKQWVRPNLDHALMFAATEIGEAMDLVLRRVDYVRNNPSDTPSNDDIAEEVFDFIMMGCIALDCLGRDLESVARKKLGKMDGARRDAIAHSSVASHSDYNDDDLADIFRTMFAEAGELGLTYSLKDFENMANLFDKTFCPSCYRIVGRDLIVGGWCPRCIPF